MSEMLPELPSWRDYYKVQADNADLQMAEHNMKRKARLERDNSSNLANSAFQEKTKFDYNTIGTNEVAKKDDNWLANLAETPVIKNVLDAMNVGVYTSAANANAFQQAEKKALETGNPLDFLGEGFNQIVNHNPLVTGVKAALGDDSSKQTFADVIKTQQEIAGIDPESDASKNVQGWGGFAGDVIMDPLSYLSLGTGALVKGGVKGLREGSKVAKEAAKEAVEKGVKDPRLERIAANEKGRLGTAKEYAVEAFKNDPNKGFIFKNLGKSRALNEGRGADLTLEEATVGNKVKPMQEEIDARRIAEDNANMELAKQRIESEAARLNEATPTKVAAPATKETPQEAVAEVTQDINNTAAKAANIEVTYAHDNAIRGLEDSWFVAKKPADEISAGKAVVSNEQKANQVWNVIWDAAKRNPEKEFPNARGQMVKAKDLLSGLRAPSELAQRQLHPAVLKWARGRLEADSVAAKGMSESAAPIPQRMTDRQIAKSFLDIKTGMNKGLRDKIKEITGIHDNDAEAITKFLEMRKDLKARDSKAAEDLVAAEKRKMELATTNKPVETKPQDIENTALSNEELVKKIMANPQDIKAAVGAEARAQSYFDDITSIPTRSSYAKMGGYTKEVMNDTAHQAVKKAFDVQKREAAKRTAKGFRTETEGIAEGGAWKIDRWSSNSQQALMSHIFNEVSKNISSKMGTGIRTAAFMETLRVANKELMALGVEPFMDFSTKFGKQNHLNLSAFDAFTALEKAGLSSELGKMLFGGAKFNFQPTQITGAIESMMRGRAAGKSEYEIQKAVKRYLVGNAYEHGYPLRNVEAGMQHVAKYTKDNRANKVARLRFTDQVAKAIMDPRVYDNLQTQSIVNNLIHSSNVADAVETISKETLDNMFKLADLSDPAQAAALFLSEAAKLTSKFAPEDLAVARVLFKKELDDVITPVEQKIAASNKSRVATVTSGAAKEVIQKEVNKSHVPDAKEAIEESAKTMPQTAETFEYASGAIAAAAWKKIHPVASLLNPRLGLSDDVYRTINSGMHSIARQQNEFHASLMGYLSKKGDTALLKAFNEIRDYADTFIRSTKGKKVNTLDPFVIPTEASDDAKELYALITHIMDVSNQNVWARNGVGISHFNSLADAAHLNPAWRFNPESDIYTNSHKWVSDWKGIQDKGVLDFLSRIHSVALKASQEISIAADFSYRFGIDKPKPGYVKLVWDTKKVDGSSFFNLIDNGKYYPKEVAAQVHRVNEILNESRHISQKNAFGRFITNTYDPITNALKASMTTVRPGHWTVSVSGDLLRNHIAGVSSIKPYLDSFKILTAGKKVISDYDKIVGDISYFEPLKHYRATQEIAQGFVGTSTGQGRNFYINGKKTHVDFETLNKMMRDAIMIPPHHGGGVLEDRLLDENITSRFGKAITNATNFVTDNNVFNLNRMAAGRDNFMRVALAVDFASKRKWANLEEMKRGMEEYVTRWAPTSTDFTAFEAKYPRRLFYFYTWLRGITPRILDSAMSQPGVATVIPKAMYNTAYANGLNPESIGNPFPENALIPSYYKDGVLGPQWKDENHLWGINPSAPLFDVLNTFKSIKPGNPVQSAQDFGQTLMGMTNPILRTPFEVAQGSTTQGIPVDDPSQYILDNFGGSYLSTISRATGKTIGPDGMVTRTDAMKRSDKDQEDEAIRQVLNFITGAKFTDYTSDSARRSASYEERRKAKDAANIERRQQ